MKLDVDVVIAATGFRPDLDMLREVRLDLDSSVEAPAEPAGGCCGSRPVNA